MAKVTITTDTVSLFSHDVYFEFELDDTTTASHSARLLDMGNLKYEHDIPNSGTDATAIGVRSGSMDVDIEDFFINSSDTFIDTLESAFDYASRPDWWIAFMYWREKGGSYGNPVVFKFSSKDVEYTEQDKIVTISLNPYQNTGIIDQNVNGFFALFYLAGVGAYQFDFSPTGDLTTTDALTAGEFIRVALYHGFTQYYNQLPIAAKDEPIVSSGIFVTGSPTSGTEWFVLKNEKDTYDGSTFNKETVIQTVGVLASLEGAIYGNGLGVSYYVARSDTSNSVELLWDNVVNPEKVRFFNSRYRSLEVTQGNLTETAESTTFASDKQINISFEGTGIYKGTISGTDVTETSKDNTIISEAIVNYPKAFGFQDATALELTYWGIGDIKPYSVLTFNASAPALYKNKNFRIRTVEYNFKQDSVKLELYQI